jgi:hypothetical protein
MAFFVRFSARGLRDFKHTTLFLNFKEFKGKIHVKHFLQKS